MLSNTAILSQCTGDAAPTGFRFFRLLLGWPSLTVPLAWSRPCLPTTALTQLSQSSQSCPAEHYQGTACTSVSDTLCLPCSTCAFRQSDVVFILDGSASVQVAMWRVALEFAAHMSAQFPAGSRFAAIAFAQEADVRFSFRDSAGAAGNASLLRELFVLQKPHSGASDLARALRLLQNTLFNPNDLAGTGFRGFDVPTVVILLVNGLSTHPSATRAAAAQLDRFAGAAYQRDLNFIGNHFEYLGRP